MKKCLLSLSALSLALLAHAAVAQAPASAPAGSTGMCKDGTYSNAPSKSGACSGHKGVAQWYAAAPAKPSAAAKAAPAPTAPPAAKPAPPPPAAPPAPEPAPPAPAAPKAMPAPQPNAAPGGGPGMVWVNTETKVYHCPGDRYYGKTKAGKYMSEADAKAMGARGERNQTCSK